MTLHGQAYPSAGVAVRLRLSRELVLSGTNRPGRGCLHFPCARRKAGGVDGGNSFFDFDPATEGYHDRPFADGPSSRRRTIRIAAVSAAVVLLAFFGVRALLDRLYLIDAGTSSNGSSSEVSGVLSNKPREFFSPRGGFRVTFAGPPAVTTEEVTVFGSSFEFKLYAVERGDHLLQGVNVYPLGADEFDLEGAVNAVAASGGEVLDAREAKIQGHDALHFRIETGDGLELDGLAVSTPRRSYLALAGGESRATTRQFLDSFEIVTD